MEAGDGGQREKPWWILVGGRRRLGRALAEALAPDHNLVLTSSAAWEPEAPWITELSKQTQVRCLRWRAEDPDVVPTMMADLAALGAAGIVARVAVLVSGTFPEQPLGHWTPENLAPPGGPTSPSRSWRPRPLAPRLADGGCLQILLDIASERPFLKRLPYSAAKAGLAALVPGLARLLAPRVRVVGHAMGTVLPHPGTTPPGWPTTACSSAPARPEDLARALRYAADSPYLTGDGPHPGRRHPPGVTPAPPGDLSLGGAAVRFKVNEIFHSIQGEGSRAGRPCVFIRLTGCPLRCVYCDTTYAFHEGAWLELEAILAAGPGSAGAAPGRPQRPLRGAHRRRAPGPPGGPGPAGGPGGPGLRGGPGDRRQPRPGWCPPAW